FLKAFIIIVIPTAIKITGHSLPQPTQGNRLFSKKIKIRKLG
ncbi:unnamed protein product, partial [marine sediment metagenome]